MLVSLRSYFKEKGQGIVEYAVLLAFVVAVAAWLMSSGDDDSIRGQVSKTFSNTVDTLKGSSASS